MTMQKEILLLLSLLLCGCELPGQRQWREAWELAQNGEGRCHVVIYNLQTTGEELSVNLVNGKDDWHLGNVRGKEDGRLTFAMDVTRALADMNQPPTNPKVYVYGKGNYKPIFDGFVLRIDK